jgi:hypothetical protein
MAHWFQFSSRPTRAMCRRSQDSRRSLSVARRVSNGELSEISEDPQQAAREVALARSRGSRRSRGGRTRRS